MFIFNTVPEIALFTLSVLIVGILSWIGATVFIIRATRHETHTISR